MITTGRNPTIRHFERTHRVAVAWLHERYAEHTYITMHYTKSQQMIADFYTKQFSLTGKTFRKLRTAVGLCGDLSELKLVSDEMTEGRSWDHLPMEGRYNVNVIKALFVMGLS